VSFVELIGKMRHEPGAVPFKDIGEEELGIKPGVLYVVRGKPR